MYIIGDLKCLKIHHKILIHERGMLMLKLSKYKIITEQFYLWMNKH